MLALKLRDLIHKSNLSEENNETTQILRFLNYIFEIFLLSMLTEEENTGTALRNSSKVLTVLFVLFVFQVLDKF